MLNTPMDVAKKKYQYNNKISAYLKPTNLNRVTVLNETTGESISRIVNEALDEYFEKRKAAARAASKNSY